MDELKQDDQVEIIYNRSVSIQDVAFKTYRVRWTIEKGGRRGSGRSVLVVRHGDDDDNIYYFEDDGKGSCRVISCTSRLKKIVRLDFKSFYVKFKEKFGRQDLK